MNVLLLGSGGREHALAWKLSQGRKLSSLYIAPGNAGTALVGTNVDIKASNFEAVGKFCIDNKVELVVVGPEEPLVNGIYDYFCAQPSLCQISVIGPSGKGSMLEGSKDFAKEFMMKYAIPTARYKSFNQSSIQAGREFLKGMNPPYVLKADGLAAGKGVVIPDNFEDAEKELTEMLEGKFGLASKTVLIEEFLKGIELSMFVLTDGTSYKILPEAKDYKRVGVGDTGLNTGGMGSVSPVPFADAQFKRKVEERIIIPTIDGLQKEGIVYKGFIFFGLIKVNGDPYLIEYNVRMGDPETEVVIPRIKSDLLDLFIAVGEEKLKEFTLEVDERFATTVMLVSGGYPGDYQKGKLISNLDKIKDSLVFHAGTGNVSGNIVTNGGRVLAVTSYGNSKEEALAVSYKNVDIIDFEGKYFRSDIGFDL
jgi:phosphoribosylamine---glycine ligase